MPVMERIVYFYMKSILGQLTKEDRLNAAPHHQIQIHWYEYILAEARQGRHLWYDASWEADTYAEIQQFCEK